MGDAARAAEWIDLPIPSAAGIAFARSTQLAELIALEVFRLAGGADLAHQLQDAGFLGAREEVGQGFAGDRQLFRVEPLFPHAVGVQDVERATATVADMETDREGIEQPAKDDKRIRLRRSPKHGSERLQRRR